MDSTWGHAHSSTRCRPIVCSAQWSLLEGGRTSTRGCRPMVHEGPLQDPQVWRTADVVSNPPIVVVQYLLEEAPDRVGFLTLLVLKLVAPTILARCSLKITRSAFGTPSLRFPFGAFLGVPFLSTITSIGLLRWSFRWLAGCWWFGSSFGWLGG